MEGCVAANDEFWIPNPAANSIKDINRYILYLKEALTLDEAEKISVIYSAQLNSPPHLGNLLTLAIGLTFVKRIKELLPSLESKVNFYIYFLENSPKNVESRDARNFGKDGLNKFKPYYDVFISYSIGADSQKIVKKVTFSDFINMQQVKNFIWLIYESNLVERLGKLLEPRDGKLRIRISCPSCCLIDKDLNWTKIQLVNGKMQIQYRCPSCKKEEVTDLSKEEDWNVIDLNTTIRSFLRILCHLSFESERSIFVEGRDWLYTDQILQKAIALLGKNFLNRTVEPAQQTHTFFTPLVLCPDYSKISKSVHKQQEHEVCQRFTTIPLERLESVANQLEYFVIEFLFKDFARMVRDYSVEQISQFIKI